MREQPIIFLDVNIPIYAAGVDHPLKASCVWVMEAVAEGRLAVAIDVEIVQEILHRFGAIRQPTIGVNLAESILELVPTILPITLADTRKTVEIFQRHVSQGIAARDAVHAAVMKNNGLTHILSVDQHFDRIDGIIRVNIGVIEDTRRRLEELNASGR